MDDIKLNQAAREYVQGNPHYSNGEIILAFSDGAKWHEQQYKWTKTSEKMPPFNEMKLFCFPATGRIEVAMITEEYMYFCGDSLWEINPEGSDEMYWRELPELPKMIDFKFKE